RTGVSSATTPRARSDLAVLGERTVEPVCVERPLGVARRPAEPARLAGPRPAGLALDGENVARGYAGRDVLAGRLLRRPVATGAAFSCAVHATVSFIRDATHASTSDQR